MSGHGLGAYLIPATQPDASQTTGTDRGINRQVSRDQAAQRTVAIENEDIQEARFEDIESDRFMDDDVPDDEQRPDFGYLDDQDGPTVDQQQIESPHRRTAPPDIAIWRGSEGLEYSIRQASAALIESGQARWALSVQEVLDGCARGIKDLLSRASAALSDLRGLWDELPVETQDRLKTNWKIPSLPRYGDCVVALGPGQVSVPLQFFWWKGNLDEVVSMIESRDDVLNIAQAQVVEDVQQALREVYETIAPNTVGWLFNWVRATRAHAEIVNRHRLWFRASPEASDAVLKSLRECLVKAESERFKQKGLTAPSLDRAHTPVLRRVLVRGLG